MTIANSHFKSPKVKVKLLFMKDAEIRTAKPTENNMVETRLLVLISSSRKYENVKLKHSRHGF